MTAALARPKVRFDLDAAQRAHDAWGANCGPGALAAILGLTLDEVRPHMGGFERKGYTNPSLMYAALKSAARGQYSERTLHGGGHIKRDWPPLGLCRVQWEGPWTAPGVPRYARYRYTHWIGCCAPSLDCIGIFDINCMNNGSGWVSLDDWRNILVPWLLNELYPKASGNWHLTHAIDVTPPITPAGTQ